MEILHKTSYYRESDTKQYFYLDLQGRRECPIDVGNIKDPWKYCIRLLTYRESDTKQYFNLDLQGRRECPIDVGNIKDPWKYCIRLLTYRESDTKKAALAAFSISY
ncbi:hypothetical protein SVI_2796 [Shewanella violacea DSS12]|uniref:Uncharacterized protein n=1 Tax=Shewanella violacea (strain JCM 10179 / CIP 106290 / LMG 19151 / DSS12) TaxID=637905 RepID=D4ZM68_SHEVD|nr:hypothetical protein SVI_2796 [Shewanella violacea DSS12]